MKYVIISGSNRENSGSRKVSNYIEHNLILNNHDVTIIDLYVENIPMWTQDMWSSDSKQLKYWSTYADILTFADAIVVVAAEWAGSIPPSLRNFLVHMNSKNVGHKPALIVSVSAGTGGSNPISELRSFSVKNNTMVYIPDHVIVRKVGDVLNDFNMNDKNIDDIWIKKRLNSAIYVLDLYAKHLKNLRNEADFDFDKYPYGM